MSSITSVNSVYMLAIVGLYDTPQRLQGFAVDDVFDTESIDSAEVMMGVDGALSAGFVFVPVKQSIMLMGNSPSIEMFEQWYSNQQTSGELFAAKATVNLPSLGRAYSMTNGYLTAYSPISDAKKVMQPRKFGITWERITSSVF